jgi:cell division transport system permease protein
MKRAIVAGLKALRRAPIEQTVAIGTIAVALMFVCMTRLASENVARLTAGWGRGAHMIVYLEDDLAPARARQIADSLSRLPDVERVEAVESKEAYARLKKSLGDRGELLNGVEETMLPSSLEVTLKEGVPAIARTHPAFEKLSHMQGVEEVELMGDWVERVSALERLLRAAGLLLGLLVGAACLYIVASTIRLGVFARRDEIEILKLVGATDGFIKAPFLVEGICQGVAGAALAMALLYALYRWAAPWVEHTLGSALCAAPISFLPVGEVAIALCIGGTLGLVGSWLAVGRHVRA